MRHGLDRLRSGVVKSLEALSEGQLRDFSIFAELGPDRFDILFAVMFAHEGKCSLLEGNTVDGLLATHSAAEEVIEGRLCSNELALNSVLELNKNLSFPVESFEGAGPVLFAKVSFLVGVKFAEQLLDQRRCQVEASEGLLFVNECFKVLKLNLQLVLAGINETFPERCESTTQK